MRECYFMAVIGVMPKADDCKLLHPNGCDGCEFYLPDAIMRNCKDCEYAKRADNEEGKTCFEPKG